MRHRLVGIILPMVLALSSLQGLAEANTKPIVLSDETPHFTMPGSEKLVIAFYYAWYDQDTWRRDVVADMPVAPYLSSDRNVIARHVDQAKSAGIDVLVLSWLGTGNPTDTNLETLLSVAQEKGIRVSLDFETNSPFWSSQDDIVDGLKYAINKYGGHPNFLKHQGKPVIFFWHTRQYPIGDWKRIRDQADPNHSTVWIAEGDIASYLQAFDGIHMYSIAWSADPAGTLASFAGKVKAQENLLGLPKIWAATVMPGYDDRTTGRADAFVRDRQNGQYYIDAWTGAIGTSPDWVVITSFNEWVEGSMIEPSVTYGNKYLDLTREFSTRFKATSRGVRLVPAGYTSAADFDVPDGHYFSQANGQGNNASGFVVSNDGGIRFWDEFNRLGGLQALGYPISHRFEWNGFVVQAMQKGVLQWRPELGQAYIVNVLDQLSAAGMDEWLLKTRSVPKPLGAEFDAGKAWDQVVQDRLALLDANPAIEERYFAAPNPTTVYGLPASRVEDMGSHYSVRLQRAIIQQWKEDVPWARAGDVVVANGGDIGKEAGLYPAEPLIPQARP